MMYIAGRTCFYSIALVCLARGGSCRSEQNVCAFGNFEEYTKWLGPSGTLKFPVAQYERDFKDNAELHFYDPVEFMDDYLMLHTCPDTLETHDRKPDKPPPRHKNCNHCAATKVYSCYGADLTSIPPDYNATSLTVFRMNFVNLTTLSSGIFSGLDTRHVKIQFGGVNAIEANAFKGTINLNTLSVTRNMMFNLGNPMEIFAGLDNLTALYLDYNFIHYWDSNDMDADATAALLPSLEMLSLNGNPLNRVNSYMFQWLRNSPLKHLSMRECRLVVSIEDMLDPIRETLQFLDLGSARLGITALGNILYSLRSVDDEQKSKLLGLGLSSLGLTEIPAAEMAPIADSLLYLSLHGNSFKILTKFQEIVPRDLKSEKITFLPKMAELIELDLQNCQITAIQSGAFEWLPNLEILVMGRNALSYFEDSSFKNLNHLRYLHLSRNKQDAFSPPLFGYVYEPTSLYFGDLPSLQVLDFTDSKINHLRADAFTGIGASLKNLSLCRVSIESIENGVFKNLTGLEILDLAGNVHLASRFHADLFVGLDNLKILHLADCNIDFKNPIYAGAQFNHPGNDPFKHLKRLAVLNLTDNNIKYLDQNIFASLKSVQKIDLSFNRVLSWSTSVFNRTRKLRELNLARNRISFLTEAMLREFSSLTILDLSDNPYVCDCYVIPFIKLASNEIDYETEEWPEGPPPPVTGHLQPLGEDPDLDNYDKFESSRRGFYGNGIISAATNYLQSFSITSLQDDSNGLAEPINVDDDDLIIAQNKPTDELNYKPDVNVYLSTREDADNVYFIDSEMYLGVLNLTGLSNHTVYIVNLEMKNSYVCLDPTNSKYMAFVAINESFCNKREISKDFKPLSYDLTITISLTLIATFTVGLVGFLGYRQRWHIRYFALQLKNATIMSFMGERLVDNDLLFVYNVFVSYSDVNRDWVLEHLLPNLERQSDLKVCLHERDFQVGLSILENIIASMDRSRCILLVVSLSFVKSQWCQFELHLAQHRLLETRREELILVLLEDIPKSKRPKMLHYLMLTKTYILWPKDGDAEALKLFWKRLRRAVTPVGGTSVSMA